MLPPSVVVHGIRDVETVLAAGRAVTLVSAPGAAGFAGVGWWGALMAEAAAIAGRPVVNLLDCADQPGRALEAMVAGLPGIILSPCPEAIAAIAREAGTRLLTVRPAVLDLAVRGSSRRIAAWLNGETAVVRRVAGGAGGDSGTPIG
jgi:hypothetical protein